jgi:hypothetical protein
MKNNPMTFQRFVASLQAFRDDELTSPDCIRAQEHLAACLATNAAPGGLILSIAACGIDFRR